MKAVIVKIYTDRDYDEFGNYIGKDSFFKEKAIEYTPEELDVLKIKIEKFNSYATRVRKDIDFFLGLVVYDPAFELDTISAEIDAYLEAVAKRKEAKAAAQRKAQEVSDLSERNRKLAEYKKLKKELEI